MSHMKELMEDAANGGYAVPAVNVNSSETMDAVLSAAVACRSPVIVSLAHSHAGYRYRYTHATTIAALFLEAQQRYRAVACLHIDHGRTVAFINEAIALGFSSVMIDASDRPFKENAELVKGVVSHAHAHGVSVEAELGHVGKGESFDDPEAIRRTFTEPHEAEEFVALTDVDALAVAFGTKHGVYKFAPSLDLDRLRQIRNRTARPLVMHGTSGLSEGEIRDAIASGICKVNVFTDIAQAAKDAFMAVADDPGVRFPDAMRVAQDAYEDRVRHYMKVCRSVGRT